MIPTPLTSPVDVRPPPATDRARLLRWCGALALVASVVGAVVFAAGYTPLGYQRFDVFDTGRQLTFRQGGRYLVYEEFEGASAPQLPSPFEVLVTTEDGTPVPVESLVGPGQRAAPDAYDTPWHEGRAVAAFEIDDAGTYGVEIGFVPGEAGLYRPFQQVTLAVGREPRFDWMAGPLGAVAMVGLPAGVGVGCLLAARRSARRRPSAR